MKFLNGLSARIVSYLLIAYIWFSQGQWWNMEPLYRPFSVEFAILLSVLVVAGSEMVMSSSKEEENEEE